MFAYSLHQLRVKSPNPSGSLDKQVERYGNGIRIGVVVWIGG